MAKQLTKKGKDAGIVEDVTLESDVIQVEDNEELAIEKPEVTIEKPIEVAPKERMVTIRVKSKLSVFIGERYYFEAGKSYRVPAHVKDVLLKGGHLLPL